MNLYSLKKNFSASIVASLLFNIQGITAETRLEEIVVEAALSPTTSMQAAYALSIIDESVIQRNKSTFIADILTQAPNVNFSGGASRGRFFQIRGTGERSQFTDPINPSVGLRIDGIDFSGAGNAASLFDIDRVEILRGPQGTVFGANASAGLINIISNAPVDVFEAIVSGSIGTVSRNSGDIDSFQSGLVVNGSLSNDIQARLAIQKLENDGFANNEFLNRDDTNNIDESLVRGKLNWRANDKLSLKTTLLYSDVDNGYDGFSLDNVRNTITDQPGFDRQESKAAIVIADYTINENHVFALELSHSDIDIDYGFDEDWTFTGFDPDGYTSFDSYHRERRGTTIDARFSTNGKDYLNWSAGVYYKTQDVDLERENTFIPAGFSSEYDTDNLALYGELVLTVNDKLDISAGLRVEEFDANYRDSQGEQFTPNETLWGGHVSAIYKLNQTANLFTRLSRGFKAEGVNSTNAISLPSDAVNYDTETLVNFEVGSNLQSIDGSFRGQLTAFFQQRNDAQIKQSFVDLPCPCSFEDFIDNAGETQHYGLELETHYQATDYLELITSLGLLKAEFSDYIRFTEGAGAIEIREDLDGRQIANAPRYQFAVGTNWQLTRLVSLWLQVEGRDAYFFSNRHEVKSDSYQLLNAALNYQPGNWQLSLWGKNIGNKTYAVRGFGSFGNDPRNGYTTEPYFQFGMPREVGVSASYRFQ